MGSVAIQVEKLGKQYHITGRQQGYRTLRETVMDTFFAPFRRFKSVLSGRGTSMADETIWALRDVSFEVRHGEVVGIIGRNGAGKTTLLKILSRVTNPTTGSARLFGRVGALLEIGTGFHPELTGRENVYLSGAILGMKKREIDRKFDEIVAFSGVEEFIDTPVKRYSSGMYTRLAFAVAAHLEPEILIVDEVLAVGDLAFQDKCLGKMAEVAGGGRTVLFVSHNMSAILTLCPRAVLLDGGQVVFQGKSSDAVSQYVKLVRSPEASVLTNRKDRKGNGLLRISRIYLEDSQGNVCSSTRCGADVRFVLEYVSDSVRPLNEVAVHLMVGEGATQRLFSFLSEISGDYFNNLSPSGRLVCSVKQLPLLPGNYDLHFSCLVGRELADKMMFASQLIVSEGDFYGTGKLYTDRDYYGSNLVSHTWSVEPAKSLPESERA